MKRLAAIENFGSMNVLCSDKTGTITEGKIGIRAAVDARGNRSEKTLLYAYLNAANETGFINPIDEALRANRPADCDGWKKLDELPYDFARKRLSILCENERRACSGYEGRAAADFGRFVRKSNRTTEHVTASTIARDQIDEQWRRFSSEGCRVLAVAYRRCGGDCLRIDRETETEMVFLGLVALSDPPKVGSRIDFARTSAISAFG